MENKIYMVQMDEDKAVWVCDLDEIFFGRAKRIYCSGTPTDDSGITKKVKTEVLNRRLFYAFTRPKENTSLQNCIDFCIGKENTLSSGFVPANLASKIRLALDDFGTGYSSLERVINCPFKTIKFDKSLLYKVI